MNGHWSDGGCSCHINPPCSYCVEKSAEEAAGEDDSNAAATAQLPMRTRVAPSRPVTASRYMDVNHPDAFRDCPLKAQPELDEHDRARGRTARTAICPKCKGHGIWNLILDEYGPGRHFQAGCSNCWGWGWVAPGLDAECLHAYSISRNVGNCLNVWKCAKCGKEQIVDSSG